MCVADGQHAREIEFTPIVTVVEGDVVAIVTGFSFIDTTVAAGWCSAILTASILVIPVTIVAVLPGLKLAITTGLCPTLSPPFHRVACV